MQPTLPPKSNEARPNWVYASLTVIDGHRHLTPAQVGPDRLLFSEPPHLISNKVEIILTNGDQEQRHFAFILPHDSTAVRIPIKLLPPQ
jgi:hypothetical protein